MIADDKDRLFMLNNDALAQHLGIGLKEVRPGYAIAVMESKPELLNGMGITHGAAVFALADVAFAAASNSHGRVALALDVHISFVKATKVGEILTATASEENVTAKTGLYKIEVTDKNGKMVALAQGRVIRQA